MEGLLIYIGAVILNQSSYVYEISDEHSIVLLPLNEFIQHRVQ